MSTEDTKPDAGLEKTQDYSKLEAEVKQLSQVVPKLNEELQAKNAEVENLRNELASAQSKVEEYDSKLRNAQLEDAGVNTEQFQELLEQERLKLRAEYGDKIQSLETSLTNTQNRLKTATVVSDVMGNHALDAHEATRDILESLVTKNVHPDEETGKTYVTDENGNKRFSQKNPGQYMDGEEYIEELRTTKAPLFKAKGIKATAMEQGQVMGAASTGNNNLEAGIDIERFQTDPDYYNSIPRAKRVALASKLGM